MDIDALVFQANFDTDPTKKLQAYQMIRKQADGLGIKLASMYDVHQKFAKGELSGFTIPALNLRTLTYDFAQAVFRVAKRLNAQYFIFEMARSEEMYTGQSPFEFASSILGAAIREKYTGPIYLQGDHYQFNQKKEVSEELASLKGLITQSIAAGFYNIDIDASTLVNLKLGSADAQQKENFTKTALLTQFIRQNQPSGIEIAIGGEIGHIGDRNSTTADFEAFMKGYQKMLGEDLGISKVAIQTGSTHGGVVSPTGDVLQPNIDFEAITSIGSVARSKYGMGGVVQHAASTLEDTTLAQFPTAGTLEIHLATQFQTIIFDLLPTHLKDEMNQWIMTNLIAERLDGWTDEQFLYKLRKKSLGHFKKDIWGIDETTKKKTVQALETRLVTICTELNIPNA